MLREASQRRPVMFPLVVVDRSSPFLALSAAASLDFAPS